MSTTKLDGTGQDQDNDTRGDLGKLATELVARGYGTRLGDDPGGPYLHVRNPRADIMTERIYIQGDYFTWSWGEPLARCDQISAAASRIASVLRGRGPRTAGD